jgi:hypothetical protein
MQVARVRSMLWLTTLLAIAGAVAAVLAAALWPLSLPTEASVIPSARVPATSTTARSSAIPPLASFEPAWRLRLRRPLTDPPPAARAVTAKSVKRPTLPVRLIGTIVDGEHPRGLFMSGLSTVELKGVGEVAGGAKILAIDENSATLSYGGESFTVKRERTPFDPTGALYDAAARSNAPATTPKNDADEGS